MLNDMTNRWFLTAAFTAAAVLTAVPPASAQDADPTLVLEEIVVTGTRIQRTNLISSSPVTQVDAEELLFQGTVRVEDMVRTLPQVYSQQNTGQSNGATGTATLDLRNLGAERTLVLVNGRRLPAGSSIQGGIGADINQIPGALVESVEVLTGGNSATYGSDAVGRCGQLPHARRLRRLPGRLPAQSVRARQRFQPMAGHCRGCRLSGARRPHLGRGHVLSLDDPGGQLRRRPR